ncbi:Eukaryotic aspartyl protease family protein [Striga hermonthica]|uniref:Eukaryotic aspartyl protease family protein n=1 Tax=Striga hermonthica TaxID=68872 RepID=A0A9N7MXB0_STRHE|nr:Eukaryotic aspartyl protease family protein [Striga hermonthica]
MKFLCYSSLLLTTLLLLISSSCWGSDLENELHHVLDIASHLSTSVCQRTPPPGLKNKRSSAVVEVIRRHGPCADERLLNQTKSSQLSLGEEILRNDQSRVKSIHKRLRGRRGVVGSPVSTGDFLDYGTHIVTMGLGTPETNHFLILDTGSDLTWTQCQPCSLSCHRQQGPIFDPYKSRSYSDNSCNPSECSATSATSFNPGCSLTNKCTYSVFYGDNSVTTGFLGKDKLTIAPNETFSDFAFGCSLFSQGLYGLTAGLLGLGSGPISL